MFHGGGPIPLISRVALETLMTGVQNEIKRSEQVAKILLPWMFHFERAKKIHHTMATIIKDILTMEEVGIVMFCGDTYGSVVPLASLVAEGNDSARERYAPISIPYLQTCKQRTYSSRGVLEQEGDAFSGMIKPGGPLFAFKEADLLKEDSLYRWGTARIDTVMRAQAGFYDTPVLSAHVLRDLFKRFWADTPGWPGRIAKPVVYIEGYTLRDEQGKMPSRWQPKPYYYPNARTYESPVHDSYYYEAYFNRLVRRLLCYHPKLSIEKVHIYYSKEVWKGLQEAVFFFKWDEVVRSCFSCRKVIYEEIGTSI